MNVWHLRARRGDDGHLSCWNYFLPNSEICCTHCVCTSRTKKWMEHTVRCWSIKFHFCDMNNIFYEKDSAAFVMSLEYFSKRLFIIHSICSWMIFFFRSCLINAAGLGGGKRWLTFQARSWLLHDGDTWHRAWRPFTAASFVHVVLQPAGTPSGVERLFSCKSATLL